MPQSLERRSLHVRRLHVEDGWSLHYCENGLFDPYLHQFFRLKSKICIVLYTRKKTTRGMGTHDKYVYMYMSPKLV